MNLLNQDCLVVNEKSSLRKTVAILTWFTFTESMGHSDKGYVRIIHDLLPRKTVAIMTWFTFTENICQDDRICSVWRSHTSFSIMHDLLPNMNYQRIKTICNTTVGTSGAGTFYSSGKYDFSPPLVLMGFTLFHLCFLCIVCGPLIVCLSLSSVL